MQIIYGNLKCEKSVRFDNVGQHEAFKRIDLLRYLPQFNFIPKALSLNKIFSNFNLDYPFFTKIFTEFIGRQKEQIGKLSGGERRLVELYVIVKSTSEFVMLDEPFTHLNPLQIEKVKQLFIEEKENKGLLITDHMFNHILDIADDLYVLANGKTHLIKAVEEIVTLGYARL